MAIYHKNYANLNNFAAYAIMADSVVSIYPSFRSYNMWNSLHNVSYLGSQISLFFELMKLCRQSSIKRA